MRFYDGLGVLWKICHLTESAAASRNVTYTSVTQGGSHISILCRRAAFLASFLGLRSCQTKACSVVKLVHVSACCQEKWMSGCQGHKDCFE